jgi:TrmH family RNA methyltransferase
MTDFDVITERSDPAVQRITDLARHSRSAVRTALIEDAEPLVQCIRAGLEFIEVYGIESSRVPVELREECHRRHIPVRLIDVSIANQLFKAAAEKRPKIFGVARIPAACRFGDLGRTMGDVVVLDGVRIVGNIGAMVRTSFALGAGGVVLVESGLDSIADRRLIRASRGYVFSLPVILSSRSEAVRYFGRNDMPLVSFDAAGGTGVDYLRTVDERLALLFGSEKTGASSGLEKISTGSVWIPLDPSAESLNVSVAAGIALYERIGWNLSPAPGRARRR